MTVQSGKFTRRRGVRGPALAMVVVAGLLVQLAGVLPASAETNFFGTRVSGQAYGAAGTVTILGARVTVGKVALQTLPCIPGATSTNSVASARVPGNTGAVLNLGVVQNTGSSSATGTGAEAREKSTIANVSALGGLVQADLVTARAHTSISGSGVNNHLNDPDVEDRSGATFVNLRVNGVQIAANPAPNTVISVAGVRIILNEVRPTANGVRVNAIHLIISNYLGISGDVVIAHAETFLTAAVGQLSGYAYLSSLRVRVGSVVDPLIAASSGRQNVIYLPCAGTNGVERVSTAVGLNIPTILSSATSKSTVQGDIDNTGAFSHSTHTVEDLNVLNGLITARALKSIADTRTQNGQVVSTGDFELLDLRINGRLIVEADLGATINLPGIGFVRIGREFCDDKQNDATPCVGSSYNAITVYALQVVVNTTNPYLPVGAELIVGAAHSDVNFAPFIP